MPLPWNEDRLLQALRARGAGTLERVRFRENRSTIWSITGGGRRLNLHAAYRGAPEEIVLHFAVLVRELVRGRRGRAAYRRSARAVRSWPGVGEGIARARRRRPARRGRPRASGRGRGPGPCAASPAQRAWLAALYRHLARTRFDGALPADIPVRLSRRMTSRLGHMRAGPGGGRGAAGGRDTGTDPDGSGGRSVVEIALSLDLMLAGNEAQLVDTLLHEMAHAADWLRNGGRGHGAAWKAWARRVGCSDRRCCATPIRRRRSPSDPVLDVPAGAPEDLALEVQSGHNRVPRDPTDTE